MDEYEYEIADGDAEYYGHQFAVYDDMDDFDGTLPYQFETYDDIYPYGHQFAAYDDMGEFDEALLDRVPDEEEPENSIEGYYTRWGSRDLDRICRCVRDMMKDGSEIPVMVEFINCELETSPCDIGGEYEIRMMDTIYDMLLTYGLFEVACGLGLRDRIHEIMEPFDSYPSYPITQIMRHARNANDERHIRTAIRWGVDLFAPQRLAKANYERHIRYIMRGGADPIPFYYDEHFADLVLIREPVVRWIPALPHLITGENKLKLHIVSELIFAIREWNSPRSMTDADVEIRLYHRFMTYFEVCLLDMLLEVL